MNGGNGHKTSADVMPPSHGRILVIMAILGLVAGIAAAGLHSLPYGLAILCGTAVAFVNYYWLKTSLRKIFADAREGERPRVSALRYATRYLVLGSLIALVYATGLLPIVPFILGIAGFGFATVVDGIIRILTGPSGNTE
ncbi:ATP synthase subunit I [Leptolyngbya sp. 7M]|uniref:ATP synthase subunit I n=1 Tax=Leptolyngbya sp. 7M TaxID=2812896 RepID=UPI001B8BFEC3|nr:ATP synthase subunit I [Leptolyngbya sp. 7M]QYO67796.1 ATP synthase subunit I [Leptolyngbya sp. 7M]